MSGPRPIAPLVTLDPAGTINGYPTYPWRCAPPNLATRRGLHALGLTPGRQEPAAVMLRSTRSPLWAYLYRIDQATPRKPATPAQRAACRNALAARYRCGGCGATTDTIPPRRTGYRGVCCA